MSEEIDEVLAKDPLMNVQVDYQSMRDILSEITVQLDGARHRILDLEQHRELDTLCTRLEKLEQSVGEIVGTRPLQTEAPPVNLEAFQETYERELSDLRNSFPKLLDSLKASTLEEADKRLQDSLSKYSPSPHTIEPTIPTPTLAMFNLLTARVRDLENEDRPRSLQTPPAQPPAGTKLRHEASGKSVMKTGEAVGQLANLASGFDTLRKRVSACEEAGESHTQRLQAMGEVTESHASQLEKAGRAQTLLSAQFDKFQREFEKRVVDLENRRPEIKEHRESSRAPLSFGYQPITIEQPELEITGNVRPAPLDIGEVSRTVLDRIAPDLEKLANLCDEMRGVVNS